MSSKKKTNKFFEIDSDGKFVLLPIKIPPIAEKSHSQPKKDIQSSNIFRLKSSTTKVSPNRPAKVRKYDNEKVRKELFKAPKRPSFSTRSSISRRSLASKKQKVPKIVIGTPLTDINKAEETLTSTKRFEFRKPAGYSPKITSSIKTAPSTGTKRKSSPNSTASSRKNLMTEKLNSSKIVIEPPLLDNDKTVSKSTNSPKNTPSTGKKRKKTPDSHELFLEMEEECTIVANENNPKIESPVSEVCNLLETTKLSAQKFVNNSNNLNKHDYLEQLEQILKKDRQEQEQYRQLHEENMKEVDRIVNVLRNFNANKDLNNSTENKENFFRKSERLASKQLIGNLKHNVVSPTVTVGEDLRKTVLTKNISNPVSVIASPKFKKAVDRYNSLRSDHSILCTPKLDKNSLDTPKTDKNINRSLSRRIQQQCLMLQETPITNK